MKRTIAAVVMLMCFGVAPLVYSASKNPFDADVKFDRNHINTSVWKKTYYAWQDSRISKLTRSAFWTGCGALTTGIACTFTTNNHPSSSILSQPVLWQGLLACGAVGLGICAYGANTLMQYYRHFLVEGVERKKRTQSCYNPNRLMLCKQGLKGAIAYCFRGNTTFKGDIDLNKAIGNFSTWCATLKDLPATETRNSRLRPINYTTFAAYLNTVKRLQMNHLQRTIINPGNAKLVATNNLLYVQKESPSKNMHYYSWGDLHGDIGNFVMSLLHLNEVHQKKVGSIAINDAWKIIDPKVKLVFCGDFVDRGTYGVEVMQTLLKLKQINPDQVILVRGNHEDVTLGEKEYTKARPVESSFHGQLRALYRNPQITTAVASFYGSLPCALFVDTKGDVVQYCHGGIEPAYLPTKLLATGEKNTCEQLTHKNLLKRSEQYEAYRNSLSEGMDKQEHNMFEGISEGAGDEDTRDPIVHDHVEQPGFKTSVGPQSCGLLWNQFTTDRFSRYSSRENSIICGTNLTTWYFKQFMDQRKHITVRRAHQHGRTMEAVEEQRDGNKKKVTVDDPISGGLKENGFHQIKGDGFTVLTNVCTPMPMINQDGLLQNHYAKKASFMYHEISEDRIEHEQYCEVDS